VSGLALSILAIATLGRSFGIVAANRGVKAGGLYRFVRHPVYVAHLTGDLGYVLSYPTTPNLIVFALTFVALVVRARVEESLLARDAAYRAYLERVPWRFVPYVY
jgi:protein-S-isoprenylcysteine O-methyltransferase Ste14